MSGPFSIVGEFQPPVESGKAATATFRDTKAVSCDMFETLAS
jgi:hypothetical protein